MRNPFSRDRGGNYDDPRYDDYRERDYERGRDFDERNRGEFSGTPWRSSFGGEYARDEHRGGYGDDYARDGGWSGGGRGDQYTRENFWGGTGAGGDFYGPDRVRRGSASVGYGPGQTRSTYGESRYGGTAVPYGEIDPAGRTSFRGRGPKNWRPSDERVAESVNEMLADHDDVDATEIEVKVENGEVTLSGSVNTRREKRLAEDAVASMRGVRDVHNQLRVTDRETRIGKASE